MKSTVCEKTRITPKKKKLNTMAIQSYIMLSPQIFGFLVFSIYPMLWAMGKSFYFYNTIPAQTRFVGFENFATMMCDATYWKTYANTILFAVMKIPLELSLAVLLAVLLNAKLKGVGFFRAGFYLPYVVSTAIVALTFSNIFSYFGILNSFSMSMGILEQSIDWFGTKMKAMSVLVIADTWRTLGVNVLYVLAALQNVPNEMYESAYLDGANWWTKFSKITFPMIVPTFRVILMLSIIGTLGTNELVLVLTNGAPSGTTYTVQSYIFSRFAPGVADQNVNVGYGCALSLTTGLILASITITYNKLTSRAATY